MSVFLQATILGGLAVAVLAYALSLAARIWSRYRVTVRARLRLRGYRRAAERVWADERVAELQAMKKEMPNA